MSGRLGRWYARHHRDLPWRVPPGQGRRPDPYHVWLSEVMLQQTTVAAATGYFHAFTRRWPRVEALAAAPLDDVLAAWAGLGYYARARNLHACARVVAAEHGGRFPETEDALLRLPGIGRYTAAAIAAIAFGRPAVVVDGNVERVVARLFAVTEPLPAAKPALHAGAARLTPAERPGDHAQAMMDLGATVCTPRRPACGVCPLVTDCAGRAAGIAPGLPRKAPKRAKPDRRGIVWLAHDPGHRVQTVRRPAKGLLGGMLALPTTEWGEGPAEGTPPLAGDWRTIGEVRHTFTHFHLRLEVRVAEAPLGPDALPFAKAAAAMPTVFAKAMALARPALDAFRASCG
ncbi:MAG TPA: A/G-specific adenine glycosylase [Thermohalobaculum sp.]|nr:A/G-specific adenine glycosylase [Thermohalobaculum sp.]